MKKYLKKLNKGQTFMYQKSLHKKLGVTNTGMICAHRLDDDKYVVFDVDTIVEILDTTSETQ